MWVFIEFAAANTVITILMRRFGKSASKLIMFECCVAFQADVETDEVYAQMTLQPLTPVILSICSKLKDV